MEGVARIGAAGIEVLSIEDGASVFEDSVFPDVAPDVLAGRLAAAGQNAIETVFTAYALRYPDGTVDLVDAGCGVLFGERAGRLADRLAALGIAPEAVGRVIFTHLHGDHCGGAMSAGRLVFRGARYVVQSAEAAHFAGSETPGGQFLRLADGLIDQVDGDADLGRGLRAWSLPGHTPGHMGLRIGEELVLVADLLHSGALQLADPLVASIHDVDADAARASRRMALAEIADKRLIWAGSHMVGPEAFTRLQADGAGGYRRIAA